MAFGQFHGLGGRSGKPMAAMSDINVTPMVDVMLVLLVIFIIAAPLLNHAVKLELPIAESEALPQNAQTITLSFDAKGNLLEKTFTSNESGNVKEYMAYKYDGNGVVLEEKKFKNDALLSEMSYLYDETNNLLKSKINRDHKNNSIGIVKFGYSFY